MSYSCVDAYSDLTGALKLKTPDEWNEDGGDHVSEETDLALNEIERLQRCERALKRLYKATNVLYTDAVDRGEDRSCKRTPEFGDYKAVRLSLAAAKRALAGEWR